MFMAMLGGGMGGASLEKLSSNTIFSFTTMQNHLWEAVEKEAFILNSEFMKSLVDSIKNDEEQC